MKSKFSKSWKRSLQPRKQVKYRANAPHHIKRKFMSSQLEKNLKEKYKLNCIEVRKGDEVKIMRGKFRKKRGKVTVVDIKNCRIQVEGVQRSKKGGEKLETWFTPSKIKIINFEDSDSKRFKRLKKKEVVETKSEDKKDASKKK